jgi:hypothetical protein
MRTARHVALNVDLRRPQRIGELGALLPVVQADTESPVKKSVSARGELW